MTIRAPQTVIPKNVGATFVMTPRCDCDVRSVAATQGSGTVRCVVCFTPYEIGDIIDDGKRFQKVRRADLNQG